MFWPSPAPRSPQERVISEQAGREEEQSQSRRNEDGPRKETRSLPRLRTQGPLHSRLDLASFSSSPSSSPPVSPPSIDKGLPYTHRSKRHEHLVRNPYVKCTDSVVLNFPHVCHRSISQTSATFPGESSLPCPRGSLAPAPPRRLEEQDLLQRAPRLGEGWPTRGQTTGAPCGRACRQPLQSCQPEIWAHLLVSKSSHRV